MKRFTLTAALMIVCLGTSVAQADLLTRMDQIFASVSQVAVPTYDTVPQDGQVQILDNGNYEGDTEYVTTHGHVGHSHHGYGHGFGCCEKDVSYAMGLWAGFCGEQRGCRAKRCRTRKPKCCKPKRTRKCCKPKCGFAWFSRCHRPKKCCGPRLFGSWFHRSHGCGGCLSGCNSCGGGHVWHDGAEAEIFESPAAPTPQPEVRAQPTAADKSARNWLIPSNFRLLPISLER